MVAMAVTTEPPSWHDASSMFIPGVATLWAGSHDLAVPIELWDMPVMRLWRELPSLAPNIIG